MQEAHDPLIGALHSADDPATAHRWAGLYRVGSVAAMLIAVLLLAEVGVYAAWPRPETALEHVELFQRDPLVGLLTLDLLGMVAYVLFIPTMLALYVALHRLAEATALVATAIFFVGITVFFATNTALPVLALSAQYGSAASEAERTALLGAGEAMFALFNETAFLTSYVMVSGAWATIAGVMLHSPDFGRAAALTGIGAGAAGVLAVLLEHLSDATIAVAIPVYFAAIALLIAWVGLVAVRLRRLSAGGGAVSAGFATNESHPRPG
jgi:hypothetical protein